MPNADFDRWVKPAEIASVIAHLLTDDFLADERRRDSGLRAVLTDTPATAPRRLDRPGRVASATYGT